MQTLVPDLVETLFPTEEIVGKSPEDILINLGRWGIKNLAYAGGIGCNPGFIFRGELNYPCPLSSKLERDVKNKSPLRNEENRRYKEFVESEHGEALAKLTIGRVPSRSESWWWLALMQHYDHPTRLLDFTPDIRVALFFALEHYFDPSSENHCGNQRKLLIYCFPCRDLKHQYDGENNKSPFVPIPGGTDMNLALGYKVDPEWMKPHEEHWRKIYGDAKNLAKNWGWDRPFLTNPRLAAQHGMFVYPFGDPKAPNGNAQESWLIEVLNQNKNDPFHMRGKGPRAARLAIAGRHAEGLHRYLEQDFGITPAQIYADPTRLWPKT